MYKPCESLECKFERYENWFDGWENGWQKGYEHTRIDNSELRDRVRYLEELLKSAFSNEKQQ